MFQPHYFHYLSIISYRRLKAQGLRPFAHVALIHECHVICSSKLGKCPAIHGLICSSQIKAQGLRPFAHVALIHECHAICSSKLGKCPAIHGFNLLIVDIVS
jgi:hypothetical protein